LVIRTSPRPYPVNLGKALGFSLALARLVENGENRRFPPRKYTWPFVLARLNAFVQLHLTHLLGSTTALP